MKKIVALSMIFVLIFTLCACGNAADSDNSSVAVSSQSASKAQSSEQSESSKPENDTAKALVAYFSCTGTTKNAAEKIAKHVNAELYEIVPEEPYTSSDLDYSNNDCRANKEMHDDSARPGIAGEPVDISEYTVIYIGYPIWWGTMPKIINTFFDTYDLSGKTVMPFCTSGGSGIEQSVSEIKNAEPNANVKNGLRANALTESDIDKWISAD